MDNKPIATFSGSTPKSSQVLGPARGFALFSYGFRPFFLLGGLYAFIIVPWWMYRLAHARVSFGGLPAMYWHAHEMIDVMAAIDSSLSTNLSRVRSGHMGNGLFRGHGRGLKVGTAYPDYDTRHFLVSDLRLFGGVGSAPALDYSISKDRETSALLVE